jgi:hypothetical protein
VKINTPCSGFPLFLPICWSLVDFTGVWKSGTSCNFRVSTGENCCASTRPCVLLCRCWIPPPCDLHLLRIGLQFRSCGQPTRPPTSFLCTLTLPLACWNRVTLTLESLTFLDVGIFSLLSSRRPKLLITIVETESLYLTALALTNNSLQAGVTYMHD